MNKKVIDGYEAAAESLIAPYEALSCDRIYAPVADLFPVAPARVIDIGAGTGRDAAWLASRGHRVTAVEPVAGFRAVGQRLHKGRDIRWIDDRLPDLAQVLSRKGGYDVVLLGGVWQHLSDAERALAWNVLYRLMAPAALMILSLRHGPGVPGRPVYAARDADIVAAARRLGLDVVRHRHAASIQPGNRAAGVTWTWFALRR
nr:class I SAM-dependent methyltransferase [Seohaeicola saemankumensis]